MDRLQTRLGPMRRGGRPSDAQVLAKAPERRKIREALARGVEPTSNLPRSRHVLIVRQEQRLGEGRLTDDAGRVVDFRMTLIVMTSNIGVTDALPVGFQAPQGGDLARKVRAHFRPELYNRIDHVLAFRALSPADVERIVDLELASAAKRDGFVRRRLRLHATQAARARLAELGHHPTRGARPLRRLIEERVMTPIAGKLAEDPAFRDAEIVVSTPGEPTRGAGLVVVVA